MRCLRHHNLDTYVVERYEARTTVATRGVEVEEAQYSSTRDTRSAHHHEGQPGRQSTKP